MERYLRLLEMVGNATHLPVHLFSDGIYSASAKFWDNTDADAPFRHDKQLFASIFSTLPGCALVADKEFEDIFYGFLPLEETVHLVIGPYTVFALEENSRYQYMTQHSMTDFQNFMFPIVSHQQVRGVIELALFSLQKESCEIKDLTRGSAKPVAAPNPRARTPRENTRDHQHHSYRYEQTALNYIRICDEEGFLRALESGGGHMGTMSRSATKQSEYISVLGVSIIVRTAIESGVDPYRAYELNDRYLQEISETTTSQQHYQVLKSAAHQLIEEIRQVRNTQQALPHVERVKRYVRANLSSPITLKDLSKAVGVSPNYLASVFKKQENMTISEFILQERIVGAKYMLKVTNLPISDIAAYLCFSSHSHLSAAFKAQLGQTPREFRNENQILD